jgi:hypothetical protein
MPNHTNKQQPLPPNLEDIRQDNDGGVIAISGLDYQFHFAAQKCLEMLADPHKYEYVSSETHEDVVVKLKDGSYQFYQVKLKDNEQWDLSDLKSRGVWKNFIRVRGELGPNNSFWFVSDQTAKFSTQRGRGSRNPDLGQMKKMTKSGQTICNQNERDRSIVAELIARLDRDWGFNNPAESESFFWSIRILTDYEHENGLESLNILKLQRLLELRGISADSENLVRIYNSIINLLRRRVKAPDTATYQEIIQMRQIRSHDLETCISGPFTNPKGNQFLLGHGYEEPQMRSLRQKTELLPHNVAQYFIESRNRFAYIYHQQVSFAASYISDLRHAVYSVCHHKKVFALDNAPPMQNYKTIYSSLEELAKHEQAKRPPIEVTTDYLHGMMCQLTAECHHDWYPLE